MKFVMNRVGHGVLLLLSSFKFLFKFKILLLIVFMTLGMALLHELIAAFFVPSVLRHQALYFINVVLEFFFTVTIAMAVHDFFRFNNFGLRNVISRSIQKGGEILLLTLISIVFYKITAATVVIHPILEQVFNSYFDVATFFLIIVLALEKRSILGAFVESLVLLRQKFFEIVIVLSLSIFFDSLSFIMKLIAMRRGYPVRPATYTWVSTVHCFDIRQFIVVKLLLLAGVFFMVSFIAWMATFKTQVYLEK